MKNKSISKVGGGAAVAAIVSLALLGSAQADQLASDRAELGVIDINSTISKTVGMSQEFDSSQYDRVNLGPLSATLWAPKRGAAGPMREDESTHQLRMQWQDVERSLGPIGGSDTP